MTGVEDVVGGPAGVRRGRVRRLVARAACGVVVAVGLGAAGAPAAGAAFDLTVSVGQEDGLTVGSAGTIESRAFNMGPDTATPRITITNTLPEGVTLVGHSGAGWSCGAQSGREVACFSDQDLPQFHQTEMLVLEVVASQAGDFFTAVLLEAEGDDPQHNENGVGVHVYPADPPGTVPTVTCSSDSDIFNTGYNAATGGKLPALSRDANWEVTPRQAVPSPPLATSMPTASVGWRDAFVNNLAPGAWTESPFNNAEWISRERYDNARSGISSTGDYYYRYRFTLDGEVDPSTFAIHLDFHADNTVTEVYVNGVPQSSKTVGLPQNGFSPYNHTGFRANNRAQTTLGHDWQTGANEIVVHIKTSAPAEGFLTQARPVGVCDVDLGVDVDGPAEVTGGSQITWVLTVRNQGPGASERWTVRDDVPAAVTGVSTDTPGCTVTGNRVDCAGTKLPPGGERTITITGTAPSGPAAVHNSATVTGSEHDPDPADNSDTATTAVRDVPPPQPDLAIAKSHQGDFVAGEPNSYAITVTNVGADPATGTITVTDTLPGGFEFDGFSGEAWQCETRAGYENAVFCSTEQDLAAGESATVTLGVVAREAGSYVNVASVETEGDVNDDNDSASDPTSVLPAPEPDLAIDVSHQGDFVAGEPGRYEIDVDNVGDAPAREEIAVTVTLPEGFSLQGHAGEGWSCFAQADRQVVCFTDEDVAPGASAAKLTLDVVAESAGSFTTGGSVETGGDTNAENNADADPTVVAPEPRRGTLTCRGSAVRVGPVSLLSAPLLPVVEPWTANAGNVPCTDEERHVLRLGDADLGSPVPGVRFSLGTLEASTDAQPDDLAGTSPATGDSGVAGAEATRVKLQVGTVTIGASVARADAKVACDASGRPAYSGSSSVERLTINGLPYASAGVTGSRPVSITVLPGIVLRLNHETRAGGEIVRRAIWLSTPLGDVTVAEARAGVQGEPC